MIFLQLTQINFSLHQNIPMKIFLFSIFCTFRSFPIKYLNQVIWIHFKRSITINVNYISPYKKSLKVNFELHNYVAFRRKPIISNGILFRNNHFWNAESIRNELVFTSRKTPQFQDISA